MDRRESVESLRNAIEEQRRRNTSPWHIGDTYCTSDDEILHVRAIVDDQVVFRKWDKESDRWVYYLQWVWYSDPHGGYVLKVND